MIKHSVFLALTALIFITPNAKADPLRHLNAQVVKNPLVHDSIYRVKVLTILSPLWYNDIKVADDAEKAELF